MTGADHEIVVRFLLAALWGGIVVRNGNTEVRLRVSVQ